jgi:pimeloyl-ACP methyl ester carboxylesterase
MGVGPRLEEGPKGRHVLSAVNGLIGDRLRDERPDLAIEMAVRVDGADVPLHPKALEESFRSATGDLAVFLHGLGENDDSWNLRRSEHGGTYGSRLAAATSWTPVFLRANTGLPIAENGVALASLMERLVEAWPREVRRIALVGHSMGGLIMRAACAVSPEGPTSSRSWTDRVSNVVTLGTPHLGAPLEHIVNIGARVLGVLPESAPFGRILEYRSVGILDLRRGLAGDVRHLPHARYHLVAATLAGSHRHPVSEVLGDLLVRYPSAVGRPRRGSPMFPGADVLHVPGTDHFGLLNHPEVYEALKSWLA